MADQASTQLFNVSALIDAIRVADVTSYLGAAGWRRRPFPRSEVVVFAGPIADDGETIEVVVPAFEGASDFRDRVQDLVQTVSAVEDREPLSVAREILRPGVDHLTLRASGKQADDGTHPFDVATLLIKNTERLLIATAANEERPVPFYVRATKLAMRVRELEADLAVLRTEHAKLKARVVNSLENPTTVEGLRAAALDALRG